MISLMPPTNKIIEKINLTPKMIKRRHQYIVYLKKAQEIEIIKDLAGLDRVAKCIFY